MNKAAPNLVISEEKAFEVWTQICGHINGMALGSSLLALRAAGHLNGAPLTLNGMNGNAGYLNGLLHAMAAMGWLNEPVDGVWDWADAGRELIRQTDLLEHITTLLDAADALLDGADWDLPDIASVPAALGPILQGYLLAPLMLGCAARHDAIAPKNSHAALRALGWIDENGAFNDLGKIALSQAGAYHYPVTYLPTLSRVGELLFGDPMGLRARTAAQEETHVDRARDILFSGLVYQHSVGPAIWDRLRDVLTSAQAPRYILDLGCGDGQMLAEIGKRAPSVQLIGMEYNRVAQATAAERIAGFPNAFVIAGDIGAPQATIAALTERGIDPKDVLLITKSVVHNRSWTPPVGPLVSGDTHAMAATPDGAIITGDALAQNLTEFFAAWRPFVGPHGFFVIEPHAIARATLQANLHRSIGPCLEYTHCLSNQLLVQADCLRRCAGLAGFVSRYSTGIGAGTLGYDHMSVDHFFVA